MGSSEQRSHAFVVRLWYEEGAQPPWRGSITHVVSGRRVYFTDLAEVVAFIGPYATQLEQGDANLDEHG